MIVTRAMILAAGFGTRMRPLTEARPKPLIEVLGRSMLARILDKLAAAGVREVVVNTHYLPEAIAEAVEGLGRQRPDLQIRLSHEVEILDTGGGIAKALSAFGEDPFFAVNGDVFWLEGARPALDRLAAAWDGERMDALLLVEPTVRAIGYEGQGDFLMDDAGILTRRREYEVAPFAYAGVQLLHPRLFQAAAPLVEAGRAFSLNHLYDAAQEAGRLYGLRHDGLWFHIGTPEDLRGAEEELHDLGFNAAEQPDGQASGDLEVRVG